MNFLAIVVTVFWIVSLIFFLSSINDTCWKDLGTSHKAILVIIAITNPTVWALGGLFIAVFIIAGCIELPNVLKERKQKKELIKIQKEQQEKQKAELVRNYIKHCRGE
ncbi:hypothetical protein RGZ1_121 [Morganella phage vB_MmoM_Rgz1]|nr:hypothetical protein RGZ1_121 [Morganella phage vB_MmoM_Rgz1]